MKSATSNASVPRECPALSPAGSAVWFGTGSSSTPHAHLTPRQVEVLQLLCEGLPNKLICRRLNIATGTVKVHISCILRELGVTSRLQAVVAARRRGIAGEPQAAVPAEDSVGAGWSALSPRSPGMGLAHPHRAVLPG